MVRRLELCVFPSSSPHHYECVSIPPVAGTHDLQLAMSTMHTLLNMRSLSSGGGAAGTHRPVIVRIPHYDKSLRDGRGDRAAEQHWQHVSEPVDVVILEGE